MLHLDVLRAGGWSVAVHNDYRLSGGRYTFWLMTHPCGRWVKGEGVTDEQALAECLKQISTIEMAGTVEAHDAAVAARVEHDATIAEAVKALDIWTGHDSTHNIKHHYGDRWWEPLLVLRDKLKALKGVNNG